MYAYGTKYGQHKGAESLQGTASLPPSPASQPLGVPDFYRVSPGSQQELLTLLSAPCVPGRKLTVLMHSPV